MVTHSSTTSAGFCFNFYKNKSAFNSVLQFQLEVHVFNYWDHLKQLNNQSLKCGDFDISKFLKN